MSVIEKLRTIDLQIEPYKRGPINKDTFAINVDGPRLRLWEGTAEIEVKTDKRKRQALINVVEKPRTVPTRSGQVYRYGKLLTKPPENLAHAIELFAGEPHILRQSQVNVPNSRGKVVSFKFHPGRKANEDGFGATEDRCTFGLEFRTRTTKTSFLVGYDESTATRPFVCQLKDFVSSIPEAHKSLLPPNVQLKPGHKRHGEWFLNPVSKKLNLELMRHIGLGKCDCGLNGPQRWSRNMSSHRGFVLQHNKKRYVIGKVYDVRKNRHEPIYLTAWHEVIRNNEVEIAENNTSRTWD